MILAEANRYGFSGVRETHGRINFVAIVDRHDKDAKIAFVPFSQRHPPLAQPDVKLIVDALNAADATPLAQAPLLTRIAELEDLLLASTEWMEKVLYGMDKYNEANGTYIIGPSLLGTGKQVAVNRAALTGSTDHDAG